ncbi:MAG: glycosyltransferase [Bacteroidota bacterium]|nr:glycosyltransferase [Bacteroidota bacterium]
MVLLGIVSYKIFPARLGGQKGIADFYQFISKECDVVLATSTDNKEITESPFKIYNFLFNQWKGFLNVFYIPKLITTIRKHKVDLILIEHSYFGIFGILLRSLTGKPFVIHSHNIESHRFLVAKRKWWRLYVRYEIFVHQQANFSFFKCHEDRDWAVEQWHIAPEKCMVVTYGTHIHETPALEEKKLCREKILQLHSVKEDETIFLFNGSLNYTPNIDSLNIIIQYLIPILQKTDFRFKIIICGDFLSHELKDQMALLPQIIFTGYVPDINLYFKGCDAFLNPSVLATGIKTKLVEALANDLTIISTRSGARGIDETITKEKMILVENADWQSFAAEMIKIKIRKGFTTPQEFYNSFYWGNIVARAKARLQELI